MSFKFSNCDESNDDLVYELVATKITGGTTYTLTDTSEPLAFKPCGNTGDRCLIIYSSTQIDSAYTVIELRCNFIVGSNESNRNQ
jgi:hypothetical protein